jgi:hypothetical protein
MAAQPLGMRLRTPSTDALRTTAPADDDPYGPSRRRFSP